MGRGQLAKSMLLQRALMMFLSSILRGNPIIIMDLNSKSLSCPCNFGSLQISAPKRRRAPVRAASSTSFTEHSHLFLAAVTVDIGTDGKRLKTRWPLKGRKGVRSLSFALMLSSASALASSDTAAPRTKLQMPQPPEQLPCLPFASAWPDGGLRAEAGSRAFGRGILASGLSPSQPIIGESAKRSPRPSPTVWWMRTNMTDLHFGGARRMIILQGG
mmetsp:Transcript_84486/g.273593  ORF Transcript_84486/g.273593 Transcript_84486/m.273593 type:complete len:216 (+) Transcript_84486:414-1061(+)